MLAALIFILVLLWDAPPTVSVNKSGVFFEKLTVSEISESSDVDAELGMTSRSEFRKLEGQQQDIEIIFADIKSVKSSNALNMAVERDPRAM